MMEVCDKINDIWLKDGKKYVAGDNITVADLLAITELDQLSEFRYSLKNTWVGKKRNTSYLRYWRYRNL